jgi:hypothetical protein
VFGGAGGSGSFALRACEKVRFGREAEPLDRPVTAKTFVHPPSPSLHVRYHFDITTPLFFAVILFKVTMAQVDHPYATPVY